MATSAEQAIENMTKAQAMPCIAPSGTAQCPDGRIRVGMFFDGTGNSMYKDRKVNPMNPGKADRTITNVVRLHDLYIFDDVLTKRLYHHGPGTDSSAPKGVGTQDKAADWRGLAFGAGGKARVTWGLQQFADFFSKNNNHLAKEKLFDTYGFSRGAAIARDFVNNVRSVGIDNLKKQSGWKYRAIGRTVIREKAYERHTGIIPTFLGIFDTVASFGLGGLQVGNDLAGYNLFVDHTWVKRTVHMVAEDEIRGNFPLSSLFMDPNEKGSQNPSAYKSVMVEIPYPGTHGGVGGGCILEPGEPAVPERRQTYYDEFGIPHQIVSPAKPATPPHKPDLEKIPLRDMYKASLNAKVPLRALSVSVPGDLEREYGAYDAYRKGKPYEHRYIQTYPSKEYRSMYYDQRDMQPSMLYLKTNYISDSRWPHDKWLNRKQRTVLYMGPQPKGK